MVVDVGFGLVVSAAKTGAVALKLTAIEAAPTKLNSVFLFILHLIDKIILLEIILLH